MPKPRFNKEAFQRANEAAKSQGGDFGDISKGIYIATIEKATLKDTVNGARQASFGWQISDEDDSHPNAYVWWNQTIVNTDGAMNEIGLQILNQTYYALSEGQFDPDDFKFDENGDVLNDEEVHEKFFGTRAKIQVIPSGEFNGQTQYKIKVKSVIDNAYQQNSPGMERDTEEEVEDVINAPDPSPSPSVTDEAQEEEDYEVYVDAPVIFDYKGKQKRGRVISFISDESGENGIIRIRPTALIDDEFRNYIEKPVMVPQKDVVLVLGVEEYPKNLKGKKADLNASVTVEPTESPSEPLTITEEVIEEEEQIMDEVSPVFEKGQKVTYNWQGKALSGPIHDIDEDNGMLKVIAVNGEGKKVARKVSMEDAVPF